MYSLHYVTPQHFKFLISSSKLSFPAMLHHAPAWLSCPPNSHSLQRMASMAVLGTPNVVIWESAGTDYLPPTKKCRVMATKKRASELKSSFCSPSRRAWICCCCILKVCGKMTFEHSNYCRNYCQLAAINFIINT